ncbi:unnamed protein product [Cuscuta europaea]|uniref:Uncharacterized protein n=1 Tax=Cuscuta europaea TaxID=41803 RepID=A0A9P0YK37_CUSEU|nr:unnamed protein product [Cuscuta europaea]
MVTKKTICLLYIFYVLLANLCCGLVTNPDCFGKIWFPHEGGAGSVEGDISGGAPAPGPRGDAPSGEPPVALGYGDLPRHGTSGGRHRLYPGGGIGGGSTRRDDNHEERTHLMVETPMKALINPQGEMVAAEEMRQVVKAMDDVGGGDYRYKMFGSPV